MIKVAFLFLTISTIYHENMWQNFFKGYENFCSIYIHAKQSFSPQSCFKTYEIPDKVPTTWANTMKAQITLLKEALKDSENQKFIFLSGDSLPLQHFSYIYEVVLKDPRSIISFSPNYHADPKSEYYFPKRILNEIPLDKQYINPQWVILNRKHAELMAQDTTIIENIAQQVCDNEHYPATFLAMHNLLHEITNQPTMLVVWPKGSSHPEVFTSMLNPYQAETLIIGIKKGMLFARKFSPHFKEIEKLKQAVKDYGLQPCNAIPTS